MLAIRQEEEVVSACVNGTADEQVAACKVVPATSAWISVCDVVDECWLVV